MRSLRKPSSSIPVQRIGQPDSSLSWDEFDSGLSHLQRIRAVKDLFACLNSRACFTSFYASPCNGTPTFTSIQPSACGFALSGLLLVIDLAFPAPSCRAGSPSQVQIVQSKSEGHGDSRFSAEPLRLLLHRLQPLLCFRAHNDVPEPELANLSPIPFEMRQSLLSSCFLHFISTGLSGSISSPLLAFMKRRSQRCAMAWQ